MAYALNVVFITDPTAVELLPWVSGSCRLHALIANGPASIDSSQAVLRDTCCGRIIWPLCNTIGGHKQLIDVRGRPQAC
jgi:hypothetical protein